MKVKVLGAQNSLFNQIIAEIRDEEIQRDSMRFRRNLERLGEIFAYEISKEMEYVPKQVKTSLGMAEVNVLKEQPILATILRAGLPLHQGLLNYFDKAPNAFISAYRKHDKDGNFIIELEYMSTPDLTDSVLILSDPMLASGSSMEISFNELVACGKPKKVIIVSVLASIQGVDYLKRKLGGLEVELYVGAIDDELTAQSYIVPGLGDAGDLAFGPKIQD